MPPVAMSGSLLIILEPGRQASKKDRYAVERILSPFFLFRFYVLIPSHRIPSLSTRGFQLGDARVRHDDFARNFGSRLCRMSRVVLFRADADCEAMRGGVPISVRVLAC